MGDRAKQFRGDMIRIALLLLLSSPVYADNWVYEFAFTYRIQGALLTETWCKGAIIIDPKWPKNPRGNRQTDCGGSTVRYTHFLGRKCGKPLPKLRFECGWIHDSYAFTSRELWYDGIGIKGRFEF